MKIKLDENLPFRLATILNELGHDVHTPREEGLSGHADSEIWQTAQSESRFLITQDMDFSDSRQFAPGSPLWHPAGSSSPAESQGFDRACHGTFPG